MDTAQIRAILGDAAQEDGGLNLIGGMKIRWDIESPVAFVRGRFTPTDLEAIAAHMRAHGKTFSER